MALDPIGDLTEERPVPAPRCGAERRPYVLLDDSLSPGGRGLMFEDPVDIVSCDRSEQAPAALATIARAGRHGLYAAGFLSYELGYLLEPRLAPLLPGRREQPFLWMGLFRAPRALSGADVGGWLTAGGPRTHWLKNRRNSLTRADYLSAITRIKDYIAAGDVYQINFTFRYLFDWVGDPLSLYAELRRQQRVAHGAFLRTPSFDVLSLSPELFLRVVGGRALAKPMKGTAARGLTLEDDAAQRHWLRTDEKSRAENLMIVDLLRNDLGRVAALGSVRVPELFAVETYPTVHQMVSSVVASLRPGTTPRQLIEALFPCGSITGAPKVRAMEIIRELESAPRGIYTGAIGMIAPNGDVAFNVAIRTVVLHRDGRGEMGIGSGIVHDSDPEAEFEECLLKARFLTDPVAPFQLIETLRWTRSDGYYLLDLHLDRLEASADYFGYPFDRAQTRRAMLDSAAGFVDQARRVRLLHGEDGGQSITSAPLAPGADPSVLRFVVSDRPADPTDRFFYHKTTRRAFYDTELARWQAATGCDEVIFVNTRGELTEGTRTNLFVERNGRLLTPPVSCGLLGGTLRRALLGSKDRVIEEALLVAADLDSAERIFLGNSVRGLLRAARLPQLDRRS